MNHIIKTKRGNKYTINHGFSINEIPELINELEMILEIESQNIMKEGIKETFIPYNL